MLIKKFLHPEGIWVNKSRDLRDKRDILRFLADQTAPLIDKPANFLFENLLAREALQSTSIGRGIAVPHCVLKDFSGVHGFFLKTDQPIDFESHDHRPTHLFFCIISSDDAGTDHLRLLARVSRILRDNDNREKLRICHDETELMQCFTEIDR